MEESLILNGIMSDRLSSIPAKMWQCGRQRRNQRKFIWEKHRIDRSSKKRLPEGISKIDVANTV
jgi:hypothetical protein